MKILLILFIVIALISGTKKDSCDYYKNKAIYWEKMSNLQDSCITLMDFKTYEAKAKVLRLYKKMMEITVKYATNEDNLLTK